jgi:hypothetical protein
MDKSSKSTEACGPSKSLEKEMIMKSPKGKKKIFMKKDK